jgi:ABC-type uncharacterized transport system ATPase subunit
VENLLTDVLFIDKGRIVLDSSLEDIATRYAAVAVAADQLRPRAPKSRFTSGPARQGGAVLRASRRCEARAAG